MRYETCLLYKHVIAAQQQTPCQSMLRTEGIMVVLMVPWRSVRGSQLLLFEAGRCCCQVGAQASRTPQWPECRPWSATAAATPSLPTLRTSAQTAAPTAPCTTRGESPIWLPATPHSLMGRGTLMACTEASLAVAVAKSLLQCIASHAKVLHRKSASMPKCTSEASGL